MAAFENPIPLVVAKNRYTEDPALQALLARHVCTAARETAEPWLVEMGGLSAGRLNELAFDADAHPPTLERYDARGQRIDRVVYHPAHDELERLSFGRGIVGRCYDAENRAKLGDHLWQAKFAVCYEFAQAEQGLYCPIAMTDAAAHLIEHHASDELRAEYLPRLTASDAQTQGAMFLTEREGGSDVGANTTVATERDGQWRITGEKWFCSNAGAEVMMVLARAGGPGTRGLGLFLVPRTGNSIHGNSVQIQRLKNKLGTRSIPTGEVSFREAIGFPVGPVDAGFHTMTAMLNVCRMHNAVASLGLTRRVLWEAATYLASRRAFGRTVDSYGLVQDTLCQLFAELEGGLEVLFVVARDFADPNPNAETRARLRLLTPLLKLNTARLAVRAASEAIELLGGNGYIEESVTARFFRDAQVLPVWEGTTNILYLDALRWIVKERAHRALTDDPAFDSIATLPQETQPVEAKRLCDRLWPRYIAGRLSGRDPRLDAISKRLLGSGAGSLVDEYQLIVRGALG
jgi:alkylation response protein AidB-like acyl-CoA dehydrogenase